jgi:diguanylate cyclase
MKQNAAVADFQRDDPAFRARNDDSSASARHAAERLAATNLRLRGELERLRQEVVEARRNAYHDHLTGLPNRALLFDRLEQALARAARQRTRVGLLFLDLDGFKSVNDTLGHVAGDQLLQHVARRVRASIRAGDTACRYGGDEFVILLPDVEGTVDVNAVARMICDRIAAPCALEGTAVVVTASVGVAIFNGAAGERWRSCSELIKQADKGMYRAKRCRDSGAVPLTASAQAPQ